MLIGRSVLDAHDSGLYAAGLIVARAVMFLPQFVVVVAFPSMSASPHHARALVRSMTLVAGLGAACVLGTALLPDVALVFAGGQDYAEVRGQLWLFALLGTCMSVLQLLVYSVLAHRGTLSMALVWVAFVALAGIASTVVSTVPGLLAVVLGVELVLLAALLVISFVTLRERSPAQ
jgi:O-antigen/teichoic acid export membrane protein